MVLDAAHFCAATRLHGLPKLVDKTWFSNLIDNAGVPELFIARIIERRHVQVKTNRIGIRPEVLLEAASGFVIRGRTAAQRRC